MSKALVILFWLLAFLGHAQINGPTEGLVGQTMQYSYDQGTLLIGPVWTVANGTIMSSGRNDTFYYANVKWTAVGQGSITLTSWGNTVGSKQVNVICAPIPQTTGSARCGAGQVNLGVSGAPTGGSYRWYLLENGGSSISGQTGSTFAPTLSATTTYFVSIVGSSGCETSRTSVTGTINSIPEPPVVTGNARFGSGNLTIGIEGPSPGDTYQWAMPSGSTTGNTYYLNYIDLSSASYGTVKRTNNVGCQSGPANIPITLHALPAVSASVAYVAMAVPARLSTGVYDSYVWKRNGIEVPVNEVEGQYSRTISTNIAAEYYVRVYISGVGYGDSAPFHLGEQSDVLNGNHIISNELLVKDILSVEQVNSLSVEETSQKIEYYDGMGRPIQTVITQGSPSNHDIVQPRFYDDFGREARKYLPFVASENSGQFKENVINASTGAYQNAALDFYNTASDAIADDPKPWSETVFEPSPLNRILKQGSPGAAWQPDAHLYSTTTDHSIKYSYQLNLTHEVLLWTYTLPPNSFELGLVNASTGAIPDYYNANELHKTLTKDENQNEVIEFRDKRDRVILKKTQGPSGTWAQTYYIYDDYNNLVTVMPPEAVNRLSTEYFNQSDATKDDFLKRWAFRYRYDERKRMTQKQVPGADPLYMVYDGRDRLAMTQDGNQRNVTPTKEWTFTKYDALNRPVLTGKYQNNNDQAALQSDVNNYYAVIDPGEAWFETYEGSTGDVLGYSNSSFPNVSSAANYYTTTYYDVYDTYLAPSGYTYLFEALPEQESSEFTRVSGFPTGSMIKNLSSGTWLRTVNYYDDRYRVIQTVADHHKGIVRSSHVYDFSGKLQISKRTYVVNSVSKTVKETFSYDHAGRVLNVKHSINGAPDVMIFKNEYNELGQLIDKKLHSTDGGNTFMQSVDHLYNIRGWLTKINEADVSGLASGDAAYDYFGMELAYNITLTGLLSTEAYNGNISAIQWSKGNGGSVGKQAYTFQYDPMNRLKDASHFDKGVISWESLGRSYQEKIHEYDLNGNIKKLSRRGFGGMLMDSLSYGYTGNKLNFVNDLGHQSEGFINTNTGVDDYDYDYNGNMDRDKNKGLLNKGDIKYNYLNLPSEIIKGTETVKYIYDATGRKLAQGVYSNSGATLVKYTDYIGELVYEGNSLQFIQHSEGRVLPDNGGWEHQYHLKDHLGNVRVTFTSKPQTPVNYAANLETGTANSGEGVFGNYYSSSYDLVDHTDAGTVYQKVQWVTNDARVGLTKSISVMPGDRVSVTAYAKYRNLSSNGNSTVFATALTAAFGVSSASIGEQLTLYNSLNDFGLSVAGGEHPDDDDAAPKAFVTILLFDRNYNLLDAGWDQITTDLEQESSTVKELFDYPLSKEVTVQEPGFAYIFLSNEHPTYVDVYFDDVTVSHTPSPIVSSSDYYPFGLAFNSYSRENSIENRYLYNQGTGDKTFKTERIYDLGLNIDLSRYRAYDPAIGRWWQVDPLAADIDELLSLTPYNYSFNNPIRYNDPEGDCPCLALPIIVEAIAALTTAEVATGAAVAAGGATAITFQDELAAFGEKVWDAMGNASPYSTPAVDAAQSLKSKPLNADTKRSASDQKLIDQAKQQKAKDDKANQRSQSRQQQTQQGKQKEGKSNQETRGSHNSGSRNSGDKHSKANERRAREQAKADQKKEDAKKKN